MLVLNAGPNIGHRPPFEFDGEVLVRPSDVPERATAIVRGLRGLPGVRIENVEAGDESASGLHDPGYIAFLRETCAQLLTNRRDGFEPALFASIFPFRAGQTGRNTKARFGEFCFDTYTPLLPGTFDAALRMATAAVRAAESIATGKERFAYALGRPPGHHAEHARCGGYSYINGAAAAAHRLSQHGPVAVLDVDVHHGNGTQHLFYNRSDVRTVSIHGDPSELFPHFSGFVEETGTGPGLGANRNLPLPTNTNESIYQPALELALEWVGQERPAFLVVSLGFDTHIADPIGGFSLSTEYFTRMATTIRQVGVPTVFVQEGGYSLENLGACATAFVKGLEID